MTKDNGQFMDKGQLIIGSKEISKRIADYAVKSAELDQDFHIIACSVLNHSILHSEVSTINKMITQFKASAGKSQRINAMLRWLIKYGPIKLSSVDKTKVVYCKDKKKSGSYLGLDEAMENPFWTEVAEEDIVVKKFDLKTLIKALATRCDKRIEEAGEDDKVREKTEIPSNILKQLHTLAAKC
jgi:hypothetical protein